MTTQIKRPADTYSPLYFLASLGAGGLAVTFFMYLMFWVPHQGKPVPTFEDISTAFQTGGFAMQAAIAVAVLGIAVMAFLNLKYLFWNLSSYKAFKQSNGYDALKNSNAESTLMAMPLALAMSVNAMFIVGLIYVPGLWSIIEYLFPLAMIAFALIAWLAFKIIGDFLGRILSQGGIFDVTANNSFAQLLPAFALSMVAVGFSAPAAMSQNTTTVGISLVLSTFVGTAAVIYALVAIVTAFNSMLHHGTAKEAGPTLMVIVPIMTVLGIMFLRQDHGLHATFEVHGAKAETMMMLARFLSIQLIFLLLGTLVMRRQGYFSDFVFGTKTSPGSYALVCPGVALSVMIQFFVNKGLVGAGVIEKFDIAYWSITAIALLFQFAMIALVLRLNRQHFGKPSANAAVPAE
ncbi:hypothetical protein FAP39_08220 [Shimia litoralis]|uniref:Uncharacterized protein n=1 Tax=Shimia litoralis TaxID=420403 RepID=A0A4V6F373_9RHOB|nr:hypothetical protein [Shimia litoralis]TKZ21091.1 hypothetical protein FAP39_08220 [Shimia litoralis]